MKKKINMRISLLLALILGLQIIFIGCGNQVISETEAKNTTVMSIEDTDIPVNVLYLYLVQYVFNNDVRANDLNDEQIATVMSTTEDEMKLEFVEYKLALAMELTLSENAVQEVKEKADNFYNYFGKDFLSKYGIDYQCVYDSFERNEYINVLVNKSVGDLSSDYKKQYEKDFADMKFHHVYYALFPSVKYDVSGNLVKKDDGSNELLSDEEMIAQAEKAEEFSKRAKAGEKMEDLVDEYGIAHVAGEERNYNGAYTDVLNELIENLNNGEISDVVKTDAGYMIVRMENNDDKDYKDFVITYSATQAADQAFPALQQSWIKASGVTNIVANPDVTKDIDFRSLCSDMNEKGYSISGGSN